MRSLLWILFVSGTFGTLGCNEFMRPTEQSTDATTALDVVGDPDENLAEAGKGSDIFGGADSVPDRAETVAGTSAMVPDPSESRDDAAVPIQSDEEPDIVGSLDSDSNSVLRTGQRDLAKPQ